MSEQQNKRVQNTGFVPPYYTQTPQASPYYQGGSQVPYFQQGGQLQQSPLQQQGFPSPFQVSPAGNQQQAGIQAGASVSGMLPIEQSYIENILRLNRGKLVKAYMTFENNPDQQVFQGTIEAAGRDHIILRNPQTDERYLLLMIYLDYVIFPERVEYEYPFNGGQQQPGLLSQYSPRTSGTRPPQA